MKIFLNEIFYRYKNWGKYFLNSYVSPFLYLNLTFTKILISASGNVRKIGMRNTMSSAITMAIKTRNPAYQNAAVRTPYVMIARTNNLSRAIIATTANIPIASNRAICYSGRTYGNVYRQTGRSWIVNNNLRQYNHTRDIINVMNTYRGSRTNFAISS